MEADGVMGRLHGVPFCAAAENGGGPGAVCPKGVLSKSAVLWGRGIFKPAGH